jgi:hypothetical protein
MLMDFLSRWSAIDRLVFVDLEAVGQLRMLAQTPAPRSNVGFFYKNGRYETAVRDARR